MSSSTRNETLAQHLRSLPRKFNYRYTSDARIQLLQILFRSLAANQQENVGYIFPNGLPPSDTPWILSEAQGAVDGAEYSEAARGKRCGHIFKAEEATYSCRTCTADDTCVLCAKCFEASDHEGHQVYVSLSAGASGCCDCGDPEAWVRPINCGIHTAIDDGSGPASAKKEGKKPAAQSLPDDLHEGIRETISTVFDYMCDVFSCSPEHMRSPKHENTILKDEELARLVANWYSGAIQDSEPCKEFALVLWNDEKHTVDEVREQIAKACKKRKSFGKEKAIEIDSVGRSVIEYSRDLQDLLRKAAVLEQIKVTVTIRSARDIFREQMCHTMVEWLTDVSGCSVGQHHNLLMDTVCGEMLKPWRIGSNASNLSIAKQGIQDHQKSDRRLQDLANRQLQHRVMAARAAARQARVDIQIVVGGPGGLVGVAPRREDDDTNDDENDDEDDDDNDDDHAGDYDGEEALQAELEDEMELDEALAQAPDIEVDTVATERLRAADMMSVQAGSSAQDDSDGEGSPLSPQNNPDELLTKAERLRRPSKADHALPSYWLPGDAKETLASQKRELPVEENLEKRVRIDFMILYDLRMWKTLRNDLRHLYISTVIKVPRFKRLLGLRFAAVYKVLAQLYLVADREPEHSIINLSLQMLTTPSITAEIIDRWNFFTKLLAILYTFLTNRQVGAPEDVDTNASVSFESGALANRRIHHFFNDLKYLLESRFVQEKVRSDDSYLLQLLDFLKLHQGICPNKRALGEHVEYESDSWISAGVIIRDVIRVTRLFCGSFAWTKYQDASAITRAIRQTTKTAVVSSAMPGNFTPRNQEPKSSVRFKNVGTFQMEQIISGAAAPSHRVVDFKVEDSSMSFHHILHYTLSWLVECGKSMSRQQLQGLLQFSHDQLARADPHSSVTFDLPHLDPDQYLLAMFDIPLRVCAWLAQIKAGMWVRNGVTLRHQMGMYRSVTQRDVSAQRDIFLLQVALVVCNPSTLLASIIDRFGMTQWMKANFVVNESWDAPQMVDVAEEFIHLLTVLISDRTLLRPIEEDKQPDASIARRDIAHALCFKPLSHSDLSDRLTPKVLDMEDLDGILHEVASFRAPEGLQDSGTFELKDEYFDEVDPYNAFYSKNQREDAEKAWRTREAKRKGKPLDSVVFEPNLQPIKTGLFSGLTAFTQTPAFAQVIWSCLRLCLEAESLPDIAATRVEAFLPIVLHLTMLAIAEDKTFSVQPSPQSSFVDAALVVQVPQSNGQSGRPSTILSQLCEIVLKKDNFEGSKSKARVVIDRLSEKRSQLFQQVVREMGLPTVNDPSGGTESKAAKDLADKKKRAQERQAKMMASMQKQQNDFLKSQADELGMDEDWTDVADDIEMGDESATSRTWAFPKDTCIFCQEETDEQRLYGSLAYITESRIFRATDLGHHDHIREVGMTPLTYDRQSPGLRPFGIARQNVQHVSQVSENGQLTTSERKGLGKGWSRLATLPGPVTTSCGHLMHYSCFETFCSATERRQNFQIARNHPERLALKEFVCPLCKALGNSFLPIIWKAKELVSPKTLHSSSFDQWISNQAPFLISRVFDQEAQKREQSAYMSDTFVGHYSPTAGARARTAGTDLPGAWPQMPAFLTGPAPDSSAEAAIKQQQKELMGAYRRLKMTMDSNGLLQARRFAHVGSESFSMLQGEEVLAQLLACTIASAEISQRGVAADGPTETLLDSIPASTMTHLRVLSETCSSYSAMASAQSAHRPTSVTHTVVLSLVTELFGEPNAVDPDQETKAPQGARKELLNEDTFSFLTNAMVFMVPFLRLDMQHVVRLGMLAEVIKITLAFLENYGSIAAYIRQDATSRTDAQGVEAEAKRAQAPSGELQAFSVFVQNIIGQVTENMGSLNEQQGALLEDPFPDLEANPNSRYAFDVFVRASVLSYLLPFLRKTVLLMHVRGGIDFQNATNMDPNASELDRLTALLGLPTLNELIESFIGSSSTSRSMQGLASQWIWDWILNRHQQPPSATSAGKNRLMRAPGLGMHEAFRSIFPGNYADPSLGALHGTEDDLQDEDTDMEQQTQERNRALGPRRLRLGHPGVYELVALPRMHDTLNALTISHRCPTTGGPISDPTVCLLCGEMLCGQSSCCAVETPPHSGNSTGGCYRHQARCGGSIGIYLNIRKCAVLLLNGMHGSWFAAPYLDRHGEVDVGLKRRGRLYLNEWRYEKAVRQLWLEHGVQSAVARKLEGDVNSGGWETL